MADAGSEEERVTLRHYTNKAGAKGIAKTGVINQSTRAKGDAAFGDGVYLTTKTPSEGKPAIVANNYDSQTNDKFIKQLVESGRADYCVKLDVPKSKVEKVETRDGRDVYRVMGGDLRITEDMNVSIRKIAKKK